MAEDWLDEICWDGRGLVPALTQDAGTGEVLMSGWISRHALILTVARGQAVLSDPHSGESWQPGPEQGGPLRLAEIRSDAARGQILLKVHPEGRAEVSGPLFGWRLLEACWQQDARGETV